MATRDMPAAVEERERDLGFGAVVSRESEQRLLNRDGTFNVRREGIGFWHTLNLYHLLLNISWPRLFALMTVFYIGGNALFALGYMACGAGALQGQTGFASPFARAFFFSVETSSTIGYSNEVAIGIAAHLLMTAEVLIGLLSFAVVTGVVFARFSRPTAEIVYSRRAVIAPFQGGRAFMFRVVNARTNQIIELAAKIIFSRFEERDGLRIRQYYQLPLERASVVFFPLSWTLVHPIEATSPFHGVTARDLEESRAEILILITGLDETFSERVHSRSSYVAEEIVWNARFATMFVKSEPGRPVTIDLKRFHAIEPAP
jgi:inward rectifier potassium channel